MISIATLAFLLLSSQDPGPRLPPPPGSNALHLHDTWIARRGADGAYDPLLGEPIARSASVPEGLVLLRDGPAGRAGDILVLFVDARRLKGPGTEGLSRIRSSDGGKTWGEGRPIEIRGKRNRGACVDPSLVLLPDGRIRLYFFASEVGPPGPGEPGFRDLGSADGPHEIHSAVSSDGIHFEVEEGARIAVRRVTDPAVVRVSDGGWWMFLSRGPETLLARSRDGLSFTLDPDWLCREGGVPGAIADGKGGARLFVTGRGGIREMPVGPDGRMAPSKLALPTPCDAGVVADPSPIRLADGSELLVYKRIARITRV